MRSPSSGIALALAAGTWLVWETRLSTPGGEPALFGTVDLYAYYLPSYTYQAARLAEGSLTRWNPHQGGGEPFLATLEPAVLYPARLLLRFVRPVRALELSLFAHVLLLVLGSYAFARTLGTRRLAASGAAIFLGATGEATRRPAARSVRDAVERIELEVAPTAPALLVLADAFAPGWEVSVDGRIRLLRQANYLVRGVVLAPGDRSIVFAYRPPAWRLGWLAFAGGWLAAAAPAALALAQAKKPATRAIVQ